MLARRLPTILPPMTAEEALTVTAIHSIAGLLGSRDGLVRARPFRAPHHTLGAAALLGGGQPLRPGEVSLAHHGCLFLDELQQRGGGESSQATAGHEPVSERSLQEVVRHAAWSEQRELWQRLRASVPGERAAGAESGSSRLVPHLPA